MQKHWSITEKQPGQIRVEKGVGGGVAPEMKDDLGRLKVVFGVRYVGQSLGDTKILLFVGNFRVALTGPWTWIKKREKMCLKAVVIDRVGRKACHF